MWTPDCTAAERYEAKGITAYAGRPFAAIPLRREGCSRRKSFFLGQASGMVEPIAGVLGAWLVVYVEAILPFALSFAAGAMILVPSGKFCRPMPTPIVTAPISASIVYAWLFSAPKATPTDTRHMADDCAGRRNRRFFQVPKSKGAEPDAGVCRNGGLESVRNCEV